MRRDWDVIRQVLLEVEEVSDEARNNLQYEAEATDSAQRLKAQHAILLHRAGFLTGYLAEYMDMQPTLASPDLTWKGHELLDTIRSKPVWEKVKSTAKDKGIELSFDAVIALGKAALAAVIGSPVP